MTDPMACVHCGKIHALGDEASCVYSLVLAQWRTTRMAYLSVSHCSEAGIDTAEKMVIAGDALAETIHRLAVALTPVPDNDRATATEDVEAVIAHAMRHLGYLGNVAQSTTAGPAARRQAYDNAAQAADRLAAALRAEHERARKAEEALDTLASSARPAPERFHDA